jgi:hypothetical protein
MHLLDRPSTQHLASDSISALLTLAGDEFNGDARAVAACALISSTSGGGDGGASRRLLRVKDDVRSAQLWCMRLLTRLLTVACAHGVCDR